MRTPADASWPRMRRALLRRRLDRLELRLRIELVLLGALINGFLFWQARIPFDSMHRDRGAAAVVAVLAAYLAGLALAGAALAAARLDRLLRGRVPGPAWLALPVDPAELGRHCGWEARLHAAWPAAFAPGPLAAAWGFVHPALLAVLGAGFAAALAAAALAATASVSWFVARRAPREDVHPWIQLAGNPALRHRARRMPAPRWRRASRVWILAAKDALLSTRPTAARARAVAPLVLAAAGAASWCFAWGADADLATRAWTRFAAFGIPLVAAATLAEWLIVVTGTDPFPVLRTLPVGAATLWASRTGWIVAFAACQAAAHAVLSPLGPGALELHVVWITAATIAIALLGLHYALTLYPRTRAALQFLAMSLALSMAASLMIPLLGWIVLLTGVIHSGRRLPRWSRIEVVP